MANGLHMEGDDSDDGEVFLEDADVLHEIHVDEEELPDQDDDDDDIDLDAADEVDDSLYVFRGHSDEVYTVACSPADLSLVVTGGKDEKGFLWKIGFAESSFELADHKDTVSAVAFNFDGQFIATGSLDGNVRVWSTSSGSLHGVLDGPASGVEWLKWHPRGNLVVAGTEESGVWMWNAEKGFSLNVFSGHESSVTCGDFTPNGNTICTGSDDASLRIWNPKTGNCSHTVRGYPYHTDGLTCLTITSDSKIAITGSKDGSIRMVNIDIGKVISSLDAHTDSVECIGLSSWPWAASGGMDQKLIIWDLQHSTAHCSCEHDEGVTCLSWLGVSRFVATGCVDGKVRVWDSRTGVCARTFNGHVDAIQSLAISGNSLVSVSIDGTARVFGISEFLENSI